MRAFTAVPMHATCSGHHGVLRRSWKALEGNGLGWLASGLLIGISIHGLYDWVVFSGGGFGFTPGDPWYGLAGVLPVSCARELCMHSFNTPTRLDDLHLGAHSRPLAVPQVAYGFPQYAQPDPQAYPYPIRRGPTCKPAVRSAVSVFTAESALRPAVSVSATNQAYGARYPVGLSPNPCHLGSMLGTDTPLRRRQEWETTRPIAAASVSPPARPQSSHGPRPSRLGNSLARQRNVSWNEMERASD